MEELKEMFEFFDRNKDGVLSRGELIELTEVLLNQKGIGKSAKVLADFDRNSDGVIDFNEFVEFFQLNFGFDDS